MPITRAILFGALAAFGLPTIFKYIDGDVADFVRRLSVSFEFADIYFRWSWPIFFLVTAFTFILLLITKNR